MAADEIITNTHYIHDHGTVSVAPLQTLLRENPQDAKVEQVEKLAQRALRHQGPAFPRGIPNMSDQVVDRPAHHVKDMDANLVPANMPV